MEKSYVSGYGICKERSCEGLERRGEKKRHVGVFIVCAVSACYRKIAAAEVGHADLGAEHRQVYAGVEESRVFIHSVCK